MEDPRYPIGKFAPPAAIDASQVRTAIDEIASCPAALRAAVSGLDDTQLDTRYRDGGWTVRQVVHHLPDSHANAYVRLKLGVTEEHPTVKTYFEERWAELEDGRTAPVDVSLRFLDALHDRWVRFLRSLPDSAFTRTLHHPDDGDVTLARVVLLYAWHGRHHVGQITSLRRREGW